MSLSSIVAQLESRGGLLNAQQPAGMANPTYGQYPAFVSQYGDGETGVTNFANATLRANPSATVGDFYAGYVLNTGNPGAYSFSDLQNTNVPGAQGAANNFLNNAGVTPSTPLSSFMQSQNPDATAAADVPTVDGVPQYTTSLEFLNPSDNAQAAQIGNIGSSQNTFDFFNTSPFSNNFAQTMDNPDPSSQMTVGTSDLTSQLSTLDQATQSQDYSGALGGLSSDALSGIASTANPTATSVPAAINAQTKEQAAAAKAGTSTATGITSSIESFFDNLFVRGGTIFLGVVMVLGGILLFKPARDAVFQTSKSVVKGAATAA